MAPAAQATDSDVITILNAMASCAEFPLNSKIFAESEGITRSDNAVTKFKRILKSNGYEYKEKKVVKIDGDGSGGIALGGTPKKVAATSKSIVRTTTTQKKRKIEAKIAAEDENEEEAEVFLKDSREDSGIDGR